MPLGLCNVPASFERFVDNILRGLKWEFYMCYPDGDVIFARTVSDIKARLNVVLECLGKARLVLN